MGRAHSCWITKNFLYYTYSRTQLYFTQQYSRNTTTCFGPICGPSSGCDLTYRAAIQDVWVFFDGVFWLGEDGGNVKLVVHHVTSRLYKVKRDQQLSAPQAIISPKYSTKTEYFRRATSGRFLRTKRWNANKWETWLWRSAVQGGSIAHGVTVAFGSTER